MLAFDPATGQLVAEVGVTLAEIIATFLPRGWFPIITPGTAQVTLGGAIAADVHGKNHLRAGSFRTCVDWVEVIGPDATLRRHAPATDPVAFDHTLGGMGLTGVIVRAAIRLRPVETGWLRQRMVATGDLPTTLAALAQGDTEYRVAWLDARRGRGLVLLADHALRAEVSARPFPPAAKPRRLAFDLPHGVINRATAHALNAAYYHAKARQDVRLVDWQSFFFPLDALSDWNRAYGRRGLVQFQSVLPHDTAGTGLVALLAAIARAPVAPTLSVLKLLAAQPSALSFPMAGVTLAVDFPASPAALALLDELDAIVLDHGGRFYLAKDARISAATLHASDPRARAFADHRAATGATARFQSAQSHRVQI
jgi:FAD/FMN-containing dehydrogenase